MQNRTLGAAKLTVPKGAVLDFFGNPHVRSIPRRHALRFLGGVWKRLEVIVVPLCGTVGGLETVFEAVLDFMGVFLRATFAALGLLRVPTTLCWFWRNCFKAIVELI